MQQEQLALFGDDDVTGSGQPRPWPAAAPEPEAETTVDPDQLAFDEPDTGAAA
jgi:hypothetical protein